MKPFLYDAPLRRSSVTIFLSYLHPENWMFDRCVEYLSCYAATRTWLGFMCVRSSEGCGRAHFSLISLYLDF